MTKFLVLIAAVATLSACETIGGFGQDVSNAGQAVTNTAQEVEDEIN